MDAERTRQSYTRLTDSRRQLLQGERLLYSVYGGLKSWSHVTGAIVGNDEIAPGLIVAVIVEPLSVYTLELHDFSIHELFEQSFQLFPSERHNEPLTS